VFAGSREKKKKHHAKRTRAGTKTTEVNVHADDDKRFLFIRFSTTSGVPYTTHTRSCTTSKTVVSVARRVILFVHVCTVKYAPRTFYGFRVRGQINHSPRDRIHELLFSKRVHFSGLKKRKRKKTRLFQHENITMARRFP
jgi:hypothetical protein